MGVSDYLLLQSTMSPRSRYQQVAVSHLYDVEEMFERGSRCRHCWLPMVSCICSVASAGVDGVGTGACSFKVLVQSHYQEYGRGSSTGILLPLAMGGEYASLHVPGDGTAAEKDWLRCVNEVRVVAKSSSCVDIHRQSYCV